MASSSGPGAALIAGLALGFGAGFVVAKGAAETRAAAERALRRASDQLTEQLAAAKGGVAAARDSVQHKGLKTAAADLAREASGSLRALARRLSSSSGANGTPIDAPTDAPDEPPTPASPFAAAAAAAARPPVPPVSTNGGDAGGGGAVALGDDDGVTDDGCLSPTASIAGSTTSSAALLSRGSSSGGARGGGSGEKLKMVVVVREDLLPRWGQSKVAVMVSSAFLGLFKRCYKNRALRPTLLAWEGQKGAKVVLRCPDEAALLQLMDAARAAGIAAHCLLEVVPGSAGDEAPSRARAILALGPAPHSALVAAGCGALPPL